MARPQTPPVEAVALAKNGNGDVSPKKRRKRWHGRRDWGGIVARVLCALFALVGIVPLVLGALARLDPIQAWIAARTSTLLHQELGLDARYDLELKPWPLEIAITNLEIAASDGGSAFLLARKVVARPRIFSLLAGKIDFGEVEIEEPQLRAVVRDGEIVNLQYRLPEQEGETEEVPLSSISLTNARIDVRIDDVALRSHELDVDLVLDRGPLEIAARAGRTEIDRRYKDPIEGAPPRIDEDVVCSLTVRARLDEEDILVRRLELEGAADLDPGEHTRPSCDLPEDDWRRVTLAVTSAEAHLLGGKLESVEGRIGVRAPVPLAHRFIDLDPVTGWVDVQLEEARFADGDRLPTVRGRVRADALGIDAKAIAHDLEADIATREDAIEVSNLRVRWAGADATIASAVIRPFDDGMPLDARDVLVKNAELYDLLDDINVHPNAHVTWRLARTTVEHFGGTLSPVALEGPMKSETRDFAIYDRPATDPHKRRLMGVDRGTVAGIFKVTPDGIVLSGYTVDTGRSRVHATVGIMFNEDFRLSVTEGSYVELADIAPVADIPMQGKATVTAKGSGTFDDPAFEGDVSIDAFQIDGFPIGNLTHGKASFKPLELVLEQGRLTHGLSTVDVARLSLDFGNGDADLVMTGRGDTRASGLRMADFFEMVKLDKDPRWQGIAGVMRGTAAVDFVLGGKRDRCGRGRLEVVTNMEMTAVQLFGEAYDSGSLDMRYLWDDIDAGDRGIEVDLSSGVLRKGSGTVIARGTIRHGAELSAELTATAVPLDKITAFQGAFGAPREDDPEQRVRPEADVSFVAEVTGTLHRIVAEADVDLSPMRIGPDVLPASRVHMSIEPTRPPDKAARRTRCGNEVMPEVVAPVAGDQPEAVIAFRGQLFGGQVQFDDLELTQQKGAMVTGTLALRRLDLGALANLMPGVAFSAAPPRGSLSADVHIDELPVNEPGLAEVRVFVHDLQLAQGGRQAHVGKVAEPLLLSGDALRIPRMPVEVRFPSGLKATVVAGGSIRDLSQPAPRLALSMQLPPVDLSQLGVDIPQVERAAGQVRASIQLEGTTQSPRLSGSAKLEKGELRIEGFPVPLDEIEVDLAISPTEVRIKKARARAGNTGFISVSGRMPLRGLELAGGTATLVARDVKLPLAEGVKATADATLHASYEPSPNEKVRSLPTITGTVSLTHFAYTRPMSFTLDLEQIYGRGKTEVDTYNPEDEVFNFDVTVVAARPLRIVNNLVDMRLDVTPPGLQVVGTNERYGARGALRVQRGSKVFLQGHDFSVDDGTVSFDNMQRLAPKLDVHATTEYQRYASSTDIDTTATSSASGDGSATGTTAGTGGRWRISMHAYGEIDSPNVRFSSDPPLSQDDIVLLLQVGMTRAELDRGLEGFAGVGLETLTTFGGVSEAVRKSLPLFDDAHVGSQYSSRSGRPEPTLTVGKRITDDVRATVSTGLSESREVRSTVEWKLKKGVSVQGRYDNVNDVSSSTVGNVGADLRWRLEFE